MSAAYDTLTARTDAHLKHLLNEKAMEGYRAIHLHEAGGVFCAVMEREVSWRELCKSKAKTEQQKLVIASLIDALDMAIQSPDNALEATRKALVPLYRKGTE